MKIMFASLGCDKNLVDTENMLGILNDKGFEFTDDETQADVIVVNTCCFIGDAKQESINTILEMAQHKDCLLYTSYILCVLVKESDTHWH